MFTLWKAPKSASQRRCVGLRPDPIFIIGMHRSGTSALAGALEPLGLTVGKNVMPPHVGQGNPKGFYENLPLTELHDAYLKSIGSVWEHEEPVRRKQFFGAAARRFQSQLPKLLREEFGAGRPLIKDPRMCRLVPLWKPVLNEHFPEAQFVLPIRHPVEVALSLHRRDQMALDRALKLWSVHVLEAERSTRGFKRVFTTHDQLMRAPVDTILDVAKKLGLRSDVVTQAVPERVDPTLRHHTAPPWPAGEPLEELTLAIHRTLADEPDKEESRLDQLREEYYDRMGWKG